MTVSTTDSVETFSSGGPNFPIPYRFLQNSDIEAVLTKQDGTTETLTGAQYTLTGAGAQSGGTLTSTYAAGVLAVPGATLTISRVMVAVQPTDLRNQGRFLAETHENVFDRLTMLIQQGFAWTRRALLRPIGKDYYDAEGRRIANVADPTKAQDAATMGWTDRFVGGLISAIQGPINNAANIFYQGPDGSSHVVQDLSGSDGAALVGAKRQSGEISNVQTALDDCYEKSGWLYDPTLTSPQSRYVQPVAGGGAFVDTRYDLARELNFQRMPTRFTRHVGLTASAVEMIDGSFLLITRQALAHADDPTNGRIVQYRTRYGSKVVQPVETSVVLDTVAVDDRDMSVGYMGAGRLGMVSSKAFANLKPVFSYSDDNGLTWSSAEISAAPNGWGTWFGIQPYPASVGGHDTLGYICFGTVVFGSSAAIECVYTVDNGATWAHAVLLSGLAAENPSEATVARVGSADKWVMVYRQNATSTGKARVSFSDDLLNWSSPIDAGLTLGKNPPYLFWHEGFMYLFVSFRNSAFFGDLTPDKKYANKLSYSRTTSQKLIAGDISDFAELEPIASFGSLNGYFSLNRSPLTGRVFGVINYDEKSEPLATGVIQRSSLALVTDEKMASPSDSLRGVSTYTDATPTQWRITRDQGAGTLRASAVSMNLVYEGVNNLYRNVKFPVGFDTTQLEFNCTITGVVFGSSSIVRGGLGQIVLDNITTTGCKVSLYKVTAAANFAADTVVNISFTVEGNFSRNDF